MNILGSEGHMLALHHQKNSDIHVLQNLCVATYVNVACHLLAFAIFINLPASIGGSP